MKKRYGPCPVGILIIEQTTIAKEIDTITTISASLILVVSVVLSRKERADQFRQVSQALSRGDSLDRSHFVYSETVCFCTKRSFFPVVIHQEKDLQDKTFI